MGYGADEAIEHEDRPGIERKFTRHEIMLAYFGMDQEEWDCLSNNQKNHNKWNFNKFGKQFEADFTRAKLSGASEK